MSGYIQDLRKLVGHRCIMQCAASVILEDDKGNILLGRRTDNHMWGYFGGSMEIDESAEDCAKRELFEETGLIAEELQFFMVSSGKETHYIYPNGDEVSNVEIIYTCRHWHGTMKPQEEEMEVLRWFTKEEAKDLLISPPIRPVFRRYLEQ